MNQDLALNLKSYRQLKSELATSTSRSRLRLFEKVEAKLTEFGFGKDLEILDQSLKSNLYLAELCASLNDAIQTNKVVLFLLGDSRCMWDLHRFFPILFSLNNSGKSVFRTSTRQIIDMLVSRTEDSSDFKVRTHLWMYSSLLYPDPRLGSMAASIEYIIEHAICLSHEANKIVFTAFTNHLDKKKAILDVCNKLGTYFSPGLENLFKSNVTLIYIPKPLNIGETWIV